MGLDGVREVLAAQLETAWKLLRYHLEGLGDAECLWRPATRGPHVYREGASWRVDWPETEAYEAGPPSIAWLTWHVCFWWSMVLDRSFGDGSLEREEVAWPGSADDVRRRLTELHDEWVDALAALPEPELASTRCTRWPFTDEPFHRVVAWVNVELMKNAAEIGYCRFLYAARQRSPPRTRKVHHGSDSG